MRSVTFLRVNRGARLAFLAAASAGALGVMPFVARAAEPLRLILEPRFTGAEQGNPPSELIIGKITGYVEYDSSQGNIYLDVAQRTPEATITWIEKKYIWPAPPASKCVTTNGVRKCSFEFLKAADGSSIRPFKSSTPSNDPLRFPDGGVGILRFRVALKTGARDPIQVRDSQGSLSKSFRLVLADTSQNPAQPGADFLDKRSYLGRGKPDGDAAVLQADTKNYYRSVKINPFGNETIDSHLDTLDKFKARYFGPITSNTGFPREPAGCVAPSIPKTSATFFNKGDLGLGRGMRCQQNQCTGETACYVHNYAKVDRDAAGNVTKVYFDDVAGAKDAMASGKQFATVAMVERRWVGNVDDNQVFFIAYSDRLDADGKGLLYQAPLDNNQFNTHIPSNCLNCHGVNAQYTSQVDGAGNPDHRVTSNASFLPFDLQAYEYFSSSAPLSRSAQEFSFYRLNQMVYWTDMWGNAEYNRLMDAWYGYDWSFGANRTDTTRKFRNDAVPAPSSSRTSAFPGITPWNTDENTQRAYVKVYQKACRTCHISADTSSSVKFEAYSDLKGNPAAYFDACRSYAMPNAEQTTREFWKSSARAHYLDRFELNNHFCDVK